MHQFPECLDSPKVGRGKEGERGSERETEGGREGGRGGETKGGRGEGEGGRTNKVR